MNKVSKLLFAIAILFTASSCTTFEVVFDDGTCLRSSGAPLISRTDSFQLVVSQLQDDNILIEKRIERNTDENADQQTEMMKIIATLVSQQMKGSAQ